MRIKCGQRGYTLIEAVITAVIGAIIMLAVARFSSKIMPFFKRMGVRQAISSDSRSALDTMRMYLRSARARSAVISTPAGTPPFPNSRVDFNFQNPLPSGATAYAIFLSGSQVFGQEMPPATHAPRPLASNVANLMFTSDSEDPSVINISLQFQGAQDATNDASRQSTLVVPNQVARMLDVFEKLTASPQSIPTGGVFIEATPAGIPAGADVTATWGNISSPAVGDWIGLYHQGDANGPGTALVSITTSCSAPAAISGSCAIPTPANLALGQLYELRLFRNATNNPIAISNPVVIFAPVTLTATTQPPSNPVSVQQGGQVIGTWAGIPNPLLTDWIGVYPISNTDNAIAARIDYLYLNPVAGSCSKNVPTATPSAAGNCTNFSIQNLTPLGTYELRLFANDIAPLVNFNRLTHSNSFTVTAGATLTVTLPSLGRCATQGVSWSGIPNPTGQDWIGLYALGANDTPGQVVAGVWWYVNCKQTAGSSINPGSCNNFLIPAATPPGTYEFHLYANDTYFRLATSASFTVTP